MTLAPTADDTARTTLPKELRRALANHKKIFFKGGLNLQVASSIPLGDIMGPAGRHLLDHPHHIAFPRSDRQGPHAHRTTTSRIGRPVRDTPQGHAPWLPALLRKTQEDTLDGFRPPPWLLPSLAERNATVA